MSKIISYEIVNGILTVETTGELQYMNGADLVLADYGQYERTDNSTLLYTAEVLTEADGSPVHDYDTEYMDDLRSLKAGRVRKVY